MHLESVQRFLRGRPGATEEFPFGPGAQVFKVSGKMFALIGLDDDPPGVTLKCDPMEAQALRAAYPAVQPGYHMNKTHWNTATLDASIPDDIVREMLEGSYALVVQALTKKERTALDGEKKP